MKQILIMTLILVLNLNLIYAETEISDGSPENIGNILEIQCEEAFKTASGEDAGPSLKGKCNVAKKSGFENEFTACLISKSATYFDWSPNYINNCFKSASNGYSAQYTGCLIAIRDLGLDVAGPTLHNKIYEFSEKNMCIDLKNCFLKLKESGESLESSTARSRCYKSVGNSGSSNELKFINESESTPTEPNSKKIKICTYNSNTGELIIQPDLESLPENQRLAAYQKYVDSLNGITIEKKPCQ
jgi:hypothetical protein